jgi:hypothetical protein
VPEEVLEDYQRVFSKLGVERTSELRLRGRGDADGGDRAGAQQVLTPGLRHCRSGRRAIH